MRIFAQPGTWRLVTFAILTVILTITFLQPFSPDGDLRIQAPRISAAAALFLLAIAVVTSLVAPVTIRRTRWMPWLTALISAALVAVPVLLNLLGRTGAASSIFQAIHVVTGVKNFGDLLWPLAWRICWAEGVDVYSDLECVARFIDPAPTLPMNYGPGWLWFPGLTPPTDWVPFLGLLMILGTTASLWWLSRESLGRGQITLLIGSLGASWLLLLERANIDAVVLWVGVLFAVALRRTSSMWPWWGFAAGIWILGTWKYYPFLLGVLLLPVLKRSRGYIVVVAFAAASLIYVILTFNTAILAQAEVSSRSLSIGTGLGTDYVARLMSGAQDPPLWASIATLTLSLASVMWGITTARISSMVPSFAHTSLAFTGASMVAVPVLISGFGHQYKIALLVMAVPLLSRLRAAHDRAVWQSSTFGLVVLAVSLVGLWGNPYAWSIAVLLVTFFALGTSLPSLAQAMFPRRRTDSLITQ